MGKGVRVAGKLVDGRAKHDHDELGERRQGALYFFSFHLPRMSTIVGT
jgi:hypothetical protein